MAQTKADFIKVPVAEGSYQTMPVEPEKRIADSDITLKYCDIDDAEFIAKSLYICFPEDFWMRKEPPEYRPAEQATRVRRLAERHRPALSHPGMHWLKAVSVSTGEIMGVAAWVEPGVPIHYFLRRTAVDFFGWKEKMGWTDEQLVELWSGTGPKWEAEFTTSDVERAEIMGDEPHWYLASIFTLPQYQGKGVGKKLMNWAIEQADATDPVTPMFLESRPSARPVYMHCGFVPQRQYNLLRRGPAVVRGLEAEGQDSDKNEVKKAPKEVVEKEVEASN
ncbi:acyl-CoA N-acyltransferase [Corynespora cassiicola Philippines]|uniref:Acyl-CoA N-acyltransferase n=1 Tax=Corynespora cassiicola Philippines TaxID=1448308 RepID=A0A2T2NWM4_CORCC|nr:acyl-CoA N-acyltransferase [Corynespora cassiicola Philippines]